MGHFKLMDAPVAAGIDDRRVSRLRLAVALAVCLLGAASSTQAGCGDYLVGVAPMPEVPSSQPMKHDHSKPGCRSCNQPLTPIPTTIEVERLTVEPLLSAIVESPTLERGRWVVDRLISERHSLSQTPDRPPK